MALCIGSLRNAPLFFHICAYNPKLFILYIRNSFNHIVCTVNLFCEDKHRRWSIVFPSKFLAIFDVSACVRCLIYRVVVIKDISNSSKIVYIGHAVIHNPIFSMFLENMLYPVCVDRVCEAGVTTTQQILCILCLTFCDRRYRMPRERPVWICLVPLYNNA